MVSCIEVETASLIFAVLSLITTSLGTITSFALMIQLNILFYFLSSEQKSLDNNGFLGTTYFNSFTLNAALSVLLAHMAISLAFTIILAKGLISKKAHLVKAYFIYGMTKNTLWALVGLIFTLTSSQSIGIFSLFGCMIYAIILLMIKKTHLKMSANDYDQYNYNKPQDEKSCA